jgi:hypothetical protein
VPIIFLFISLDSVDISLDAPFSPPVPDSGYRDHDFQCFTQAGTGENG